MTTLRDTKARVKLLEEELEAMRQKVLIAREGERQAFVQVHRLMDEKYGKDEDADEI